MKVKTVFLILISFFSLLPGSIYAFEQKVPEITEYAVSDVILMVTENENIDISGYKITIKIPSGPIVYQNFSGSFMGDTIQLFVKHKGNYYIIDQDSIRQKIYQFSYLNKDLIADLESYQNTTFYKQIRDTLKREKKLEFIVILEGNDKKVEKKISLLML